MVLKLIKYIVTAQKISGGYAKISFGTKEEANQYMKNIGHKAIKLEKIKGRMVHHPKDKSILIFKPYK